MNYFQLLAKFLYKTDRKSIDLTKWIKESQGK